MLGILLIIGLAGMGFIIIKRAYYIGVSANKDEQSVKQLLDIVDLSNDAGHPMPVDMRDKFDEMNNREDKPILNDAIYYQPSTQPNDSDGGFFENSKDNNEILLLEKIPSKIPLSSFNPVTDINGYMNFNGSNFRYAN